MTIELKLRTDMELFRSRKDSQRLNPGQKNRFDLIKGQLGENYAHFYQEAIAVKKTTERIVFPETSFQAGIVAMISTVKSSTRFYVGLSDNTIPSPELKLASANIDIQAPKSIKEKDHQDKFIHTAENVVSATQRLMYLNKVIGRLEKGDIETLPDGQGIQVDLSLQDAKKLAEQATNAVNKGIQTLYDMSKGIFPVKIHNFDQVAQEAHKRLNRVPIINRVAKSIVADVYEVAMDESLEKAQASIRQRNRTVRDIKNTSAGTVMLASLCGAYVDPLDIVMTPTKESAQNQPATEIPPTKEQLPKPIVATAKDIESALLNCDNCEGARAENTKLASFGDRTFMFFEDEDAGLYIGREYNENKGKWEEIYGEMLPDKSVVWIDSSGEIIILYQDPKSLPNDVPFTWSVIGQDGVQRFFEITPDSELFQMIKNGNLGSFELPLSDEFKEIQSFFKENTSFRLNRDGKLVMDLGDGGTKVVEGIEFLPDGTMTVTHNGETFEADASTVVIDGQKITFKDNEGRNWVFNGEGLNEEVREFVPANDIALRLEGGAPNTLHINEKTDKQDVYEDMTVWFFNNYNGLQENKELKTKVVELVASDPSLAKFKDIGPSSDYDLRVEFMNLVLKTSGGLLTISNHKAEKFKVDFNQTPEIVIEKVENVDPTYLKTKSVDSESGDTRTGIGVMLTSNDKGQISVRLQYTDKTKVNAPYNGWGIVGLLCRSITFYIGKTFFANPESLLYDRNLYIYSNTPLDSADYAQETLKFKNKFIIIQD